MLLFKHHTNVAGITSDDSLYFLFHCFAFEHVCHCAKNLEQVLNIGLTTEDKCWQHSNTDNVMIIHLSN